MRDPKLAVRWQGGPGKHTLGPFALITLHDMQRGANIMPASVDLE